MSQKTETFVYFLRPIGLLGPIKVGCSAEPKDRLSQLYTWSPLPLEIVATTPGTLKDENFLHRCFAKSHSHREWFFACPEIQAALTIIWSGGGMAEMRAALMKFGPVPRKRRREWDANTRLRVSYGHRIRIARRRLMGAQDNFYVPDDVASIIEQWQAGPYSRVKQRNPTPEELARLDEFLANPGLYSVVPAWTRPKEQVAA